MLGAHPTPPSGLVGPDSLHADEPPAGSFEVNTPCPPKAATHTLERLQDSPTPLNPYPVLVRGTLVQVPGCEGSIELTRLKLKPASVATHIVMDAHATDNGSFVESV